MRTAYPPLEHNTMRIADNTSNAELVREAYLLENNETPEIYVELRKRLEALDDAGCNTDTVIELRNELKDAERQISDLEDELGEAEEEIARLESELANT